MRIQSGEQSREIEVAEGATLLDVIRAAELPCAAPCGGKGTCGKCEVVVQDKKGTRVVLACQTEAAEDMQVEISESTAVLDLELVADTVRDHPHGVAFDLGSTTLAAELVDLKRALTVAQAGRMNPQSIFGSDVISRIEAAEAGHLEMMQKLVIDALRGLITSLCAEAGLPLSAITSITLAGNTIMEHLATGLSPVSIGISPYEPLSYFGEAQALWKDLPPVWLAPCISGYVGGDIVAGMLVDQNYPSLLLDLGTNGELALQTSTTSVSAATAAGPVFEGMNVRYGMPALPGAISKVMYDETTDTLSVDIIGGGKAKGICGSGLVDLIALMLSHGLVDESGRILQPNEDSSPLAQRVLMFEGAPAFKPLQNSDVVVTQKDVRNLQLAKAAIAAGIEIVLDTAGLSLSELHSVSIAGGFGLHIDKEHAAALGLIPKQLLHKAHSIGNSSLMGAREALLSTEVRERMLAMARTSQYVELSTDARFSHRFIENMGFEEPLPQDLV